MNWNSGVDWREVLLPSKPILEMIVRGSLVYLGLFFLLRVILKRESGTVGITDLLVVVLLADAAQNAIADDYHSVSDGMVLVLTIVFWSYVLNWLGFRFPAFRKLVHPPPLPLVKDGQILWRNLRHELISHDELQSMLRQQGVEDVSEVKDAFMEGDGRISVIRYEPDQKTNGGSPDRRPGG